MTTRTVLILVHDFPPAGGAGVQRVLKFVKYLPDFGWRSVVVTATPESYAVIDATLAGDIPADTPILRVPSFDPDRLRPHCEHLRLGKALSLFNAALFLPDAAMIWVCRARPMVKEAIRDYQPAVIFSSALAKLDHAQINRMKPNSDRIARQMSAEHNREILLQVVASILGEPLKDKA